MLPDDHPNAVGAIGFMRHHYPNFGFDAADVIIAVGYEPQEFDPARINPDADKKIIHIHRFPSEVDVHYSIDVEIEGDIAASLNALCAAVGDHHQLPSPPSPSSSLLRDELDRGRGDDRFPLAPQQVVADTRVSLVEYWCAGFDQQLLDPEPVQLGY